MIQKISVRILPEKINDLLFVKQVVIAGSGPAGLFPAGEGSGYAGGIVSSAMDGEVCAQAAAAYLADRTISC